MSEHQSTHSGLKSNTNSIRPLGHFNKGEKGIIVSVSTEGVGSEALPQSHVQRLLEMGLLVGSRVEVIHEAPFGGDPIAVRVRGALVALRRNEANHVQVECLSQVDPV